MNKRTWRVSGMAECNDCEWRCDNHHNAQAVGAVHAKSHDHFVRVETVLVSYYNQPEKAAEPESRSQQGGET